MSDKNDKSEKDSPQEEAEGPVGGERLAEARREQQISVLEIAKELHLDEHKVHALERNEFESLGAPVFAKGHLKKYAQLVAIDEADVLTDYYRLTRTADIPPVVSSRPRPRKEMTPGPWIAVIVIIILVVTAYWWFTTRPLDIDDVPAPEEQMQPDALPADDTTVVSPPADVEVEDGDATDEPLVEEAPADVAEPEPAPPVEAGQLRLLITYSGDCWTEITDATGRRLFFGLGSDGRTVELSGEAPFNVLFGDADNVSLAVDGADYAIPASARRGRTARFSIAGS